MLTLIYFMGIRGRATSAVLLFAFSIFYLGFILSCDLNSLWDSFHQGRGHVAEMVYSFLTQLEGKGPWAPHKRAV